MNLIEFHDKFNYEGKFWDCLPYCDLNVIKQKFSINTEILHILLPSSSSLQFKNKVVNKDIQFKDNIGVYEHDEDSKKLIKMSSVAYGDAVIVVDYEDSNVGKRKRSSGGGSTQPSLKLPLEDVDLLEKKQRKSPRLAEKELLELLDKESKKVKSTPTKSTPTKKSKKLNYYDYLKSKEGKPFEPMKNSAGAYTCKCKRDNIKKNCAPHTEWKKKFDAWIAKNQT